MEIQDVRLGNKLSTSYLHASILTYILFIMVAMILLCLAERLQCLLQESINCCFFVSSKVTKVKKALTFII